MRRLRFLLTSGPTREPLDPVRYLSNYSTGTMGRYLASAIRRRGHALTWVRCPQDVETTAQLLKRLQALIVKQDVLVMAAAVCDVRPARTASSKIKKAGLKALILKQNPDVMATLARRKRTRQTFVGFALESSRLKENALQKLDKKGMDLILVQRVTSHIKPFGDARIGGAIYASEGVGTPLFRASKARVAGQLIRRAEALAFEKLRVA